MRKIILALLIAVTVAGASSIATARMGGYYAQPSNDGNWFNQMYQWMGNHIGHWGGPMMGYGYYSVSGGHCPGFGAWYYQNNNTTEFVTIEEAAQLIKDSVDGTVTSEVYRMGHWYVVFYEDPDGITRQARVDILTGEVYSDFYGYMSENSETYNNCRYAGHGRMMWG